MMTSIMSIMKTGLADGFNPCIVAAAVLLFLHFSFVGKSYIHLKKAGVFFIAGFILATYFFLVSYDRVMTSTGAQIALYNAQLMLGIVLILVGMVSFYDWLSFRQHQNFSKLLIQFPQAFENPNSAQSSGKLKTLAFSSLLLGMFVGWLASAWPPSSSLAGQYTELFLPGKIAKGFFLFALYALCITAPVTFVFVLILWAARLRIRLNDIKAYASLIKVANSALDVGLGVGLVYIFY